MDTARKSPGFLHLLPLKGGGEWLHMCIRHKETSTYLMDEVALDDLIVDALMEEDTRSRLRVRDEGIMVLLKAMHLRGEDMAARYGGEEFAVLAAYTTAHQAVAIAEKARKSIASHNFGSLPPITVSIGCATYRQGERMESLIQRADLALYDAKNNGKNKVSVR